MDRLLIGRSNYRLFSYLVALNFAGTLIFSTSLASEAPSGLVYQGRIMKPDNSPLEAVSVLFDIEVYSPDGACLLFEETHTINMASSGGSFALTLGTGTPIGLSYFVKEVFSNTGAFTGAGPCSYSPSTGDSRRIRVTFDDGGGPVALQDQIVQSVPYALYASKLEGKGKSDFLQINTTTSALSQANANSLFQNATYTELMALAGGTSTLFAKSADLPVSSGVLNLSGAGQGVRVLDVPAGGDYAVNKNYSDGKIGGKSIDAADFAGLANGESVKWDTTANSGLGGWVRYTPASTSGFVVNGGQVGAVSLGSSDANALSLLTNNSARLTVNSSGMVGIGTSAPYSNLHISHPGGTGLTNPAELRLLNSTDQGSSQIIMGETDSAGAYDGMRIRYHSTSDGTYNALQVLGHHTGGDTGVHLSINRNNGYVGIGTTSPSSALDVVGTVTVAEPGTNSVIIGYGNSASASGASAIGSGNSVGFNTNSTAMGHSNDSSLGGSSFGRGNTTSGSTAIAFGDGNSVSGAAAAAFGIGVSNTTANSLMIGPSDAAKVTILSSGNVGIGTTTPERNA
ncbi:MAG: hypothetical protein IPK68_11930 [Bdellovibrionales bacterium]|nr:hypothetical protein [Bdellovibrionales bacterium]